MKRNKFSLSHYKLLSCDAGELIPVTWFEGLPGDTIQASTSALVRAAYLLSPVMHPVDVRFHWWQVPIRLLWDDFEKFITGGPDGLDATVFPQIVHNNITVGTLEDYLGLPLGTFTNRSVSALPFRAYAQIYNHWYRDQDLVTPLPVSSGSGVDSTTNRTLQVCGWEKDYFTSSRPWEQKGPTVTLPLGTSAPVKGIGFTGTLGSTPTAQATVRESTPLPNRSYTFGTGTGSTGIVVESDTNVTSTAKPLIYADLQNASAVTVNALREALALQRYEEARARYGSRYTEYLRYLGVQSSDARLQLPEYLGGGRNTIQFSEVLQTGPEAGGAGVGKMRGHGVNGTRSRRWRRFIEEHSIIMCLMSIRPKTIYMQGLHRSWHRDTKDMYWQKEFEHVGQQEIRKKEIYALSADPNGTFGYQDRYDEYRRMESTVAGEFRTSTLNYWHMAREFGSEPALNASFVNCVPTERTFAVPSEDVYYVYAKHSVQARRMLTRTGTSFIK